MGNASGIEKQARITGLHNIISLEQFEALARAEEKEERKRHRQERERLDWVPEVLRLAAYKKVRP
jgi:hypothetical protein